MRLRYLFPNGKASGAIGHLWEQVVLPFRVKGALLWNPTCTGPLAVSDQVITVHDLSTLDHPEWFDWKYALWHRLIVPILLRRVRRIIAISAFTKRRILSHGDIPSERITVVYNGVDQRFRPCAEKEVMHVREALGIGEGPYVLSLSALHPRKNMARLLQAWELAAEQIPEVHFVLAGGAGRENVFGQFSLGAVPARVHLTGYVEDQHLPALYSGAEAFIYPSLYEGFGLPVLEAMACGTPVITSDVTSLPEVAGDAALLLNPFDVEAMAEEIVRVMEDDALRRQLRKKGLERARRFTWERTAEETWQVLQSAVA